MQQVKAIGSNGLEMAIKAFRIWGDSKIEKQPVHTA